VVTATSIQFYDDNARQLADRYESTTFEAVHGDLIEFLPEKAGTVLDVGAGSGRDAAALAERGLRVTAIEPSATLRAHGEALHRGSEIEWIDDQLPGLHELRSTGRHFDFVLCSAVLMYIPPENLAQAMASLADLLAAGGRLAISVRDRMPRDPLTIFHPVSDTDLRLAAQSAGLSLLAKGSSSDPFGRQAACWLSYVFDRSEEARGTD